MIRPATFKTDCFKKVLTPTRGGKDKSLFFISQNKKTFSLSATKEFLLLTLNLC